jgi:hypothetical protein
LNSYQSGNWHRELGEWQAEAEPKKESSNDPDTDD